MKAPSPPREATPLKIFVTWKSVSCGIARASIKASGMIPLRAAWSSGRTLHWLLTFLLKIPLTESNPPLRVGTPVCLAIITTKVVNGSCVVQKWSLGTPEAAARLTPKGSTQSLRDLPLDVIGAPAYFAEQRKEFLSCAPRRR
jgi:hypothetical protein